jgi:hypothetical protein
MPAKDRAHYGGSYHRRAAAVRAAAIADPNTRCWRCNGLARAGDPWQAGHVIDHDVSSPLLAEHRSCNARAGKRQGEPRSRVW